MATAKTKGDSLGFYLSDPSGLGGARRDAEFWPFEPVILSTIPPIIIERVSAGCGEGAARIVAASADSLQFAAPGEDLGAAVTVAANSSALLESETPGKTVRVYRHAGYSAADLGGEMRFYLRPGINNAVALEDATVAGGTRYGCFWIKNHGARPVTGIVVTAGTNYAVGFETPSGGRVQETANTSTAPSGVSFGATANVGTLAKGASVAIRLRRVLSSPSVSLGATGQVTVAFTVDGVDYSEALTGLYRVSDPSLAGYHLFVGEDALPDFSGAAAAFSATLPMVQALTPGARSYWCVREASAFGLSSQNTLCRTVNVGAGGEDDTEALTNPEVLSLTSAVGGEVDVHLRYSGGMDETPADTWRLYVATGGSTPDPDVDTPADTAMVVQGFGGPVVEKVLRLGPYAYGVPVKVIARVYSSELDAESDSTTVHSVTISTQAPVGPHFAGVAMGESRGLGQSLMEGSTAYGDATVRVSTGETIIEGSGEVFRAELGILRLFRTGLAFKNQAQGAAGSSSPIEAVSADEIYLNVAGVRRAKIDLSNGRIEASEFVMLETAIDLPIIGPVVATATAVYLMVRHGLTGRWTPAIKVDEQGTMTVCLPVLQEFTEMANEFSNSNVTGSLKVGGVGFGVLRIAIGATFNGQTKVIPSALSSPPDLAVTEQDTPDMTAKVAPGACVIAGVLDGLEAETDTPVFVAPSTNDVIAIVQIKDGAPEIKYGTEAGSPVAPTVDAGYIQLAEVYLTPAHTTVETADITDSRQFA